MNWFKTVGVFIAVLCCNTQDVLSQNGSDHTLEPLSLAYSSYFGRIYPNSRIIRSNESKYGFSIVEGDQFVFLLFKDEDTRDPNSIKHKTVFEMNELPVKDTIIDHHDLDQFSYLESSNQSTDLIDLPAEKKRRDLKIFPVRDIEYRILFFDKASWHDQQTPLFGDGVYLYLMNSSKDSIIFHSHLPVNKRPLLHEKSFFEERNLLLGNSRGDMICKIIYSDGSYHNYGLKNDKLLTYSFESEEKKTEYQAIEYKGVWALYKCHFEQFSFSLTEEKGQQRIFYPDSSYQVLQAVGKCNDLKKKGKWRYYYKNGQLKAVGKHQLTEDPLAPSGQTGKWRYYYNNGQLMAKVHFVSDKVNGQSRIGKKSKFYSRDGKNIEKQDLSTFRTRSGTDEILPLYNYFALVRVLYNWNDLDW